MFVCNSLHSTLQRVVSLIISVLKIEELGCVHSDTFTGKVDL